MNKSIFEFFDYKSYLLSLIEAAPQQGRGLRRQLAEFTGCQIAYVSHVLAADRHFNLEQAEAIARFFKLREDETEFFLLLVEYGRAGTEPLRSYLKKQIERRQSQFNEIKSRIRINKEISAQDQAEYYSSWHFQAIHTVLTIRDCRRVDEIVRRLGLSSERVNQVLRFLLEKGLVSQEGSEYIPSEKQIHLPRTSPLISKMHSNWRVQTLAAMDHMRADDFHYSGVVTLSRKDAGAVKEILLKALASATEVIGPSNEEQISVLALDFYEL